MEPQIDEARTAQEQAFNAKLEEVVAQLGIALHAVARRPSGSHETVREEWAKLGRSFAELLGMEPLA